MQGAGSLCDSFRESTCFYLQHPDRLEGFDWCLGQSENAVAIGRGAHQAGPDESATGTEGRARGLPKVGWMRGVARTVPVSALKATVFPDASLTASAGPPSGARASSAAG